MVDGDRIKSMNMTIICLHRVPSTSKTIPCNCFVPAAASLLGSSAANGHCLDLLSADMGRDCAKTKIHLEADTADDADVLIERRVSSEAQVLTILAQESM